MKKVLLILTFWLFLIFCRSVQAQGLVGYWGFDEGSGGFAFDISGNENHGVIYNASWIDGKFGKALDFSGSYVSMMNSPSLNITNAITIEAWIKLNNWSVTQNFILKGWTGESGYMLHTGWTPNELVFILVSETGGNNGIGINNFFEPGNWTYLVATFDGSVMKVYKNNKLIASQPFFGKGIKTNDNSLKLGDFDGTLDEVKIYNRALSEEEINSSYSKNNFVEFSGKLMDKNNNPVQANLTFYNPSTNEINYSTQSTDGNYDVLVKEGFYDIAFNFTNNLLIKFLSVHLAADTYNFLEKIYSLSGNKLSLILNISTNQMIEINGIIPLNVKLNYTNFTKVTSYPQQLKEWFYNSSSQKLYVKTPPIVPLSLLHVDGQWIADEIGRRVQLRGAGSDYTAYGGGMSTLGTYVQWMKETGCNVIRLAFVMPNPNSTWATTSGTTYDATDMTAILNLLALNGIYAIVDDHEYTATTVLQGWEAILPDYEQEWLNDWVSIANTFKNNPTIAAYELINEPYGWSESPNNDYAPNSTFVQAMDACIQDIRATGDNHIIMASEGYYGYGFTVSGADDPSYHYYLNASQISAYTNICVDIHMWHHYGLDGGNDTWFQDIESYNSPVPYLVASEYIAGALALRTKLGCPVFLGEFGAYNYSMSSTDAVGLQQTIEMAEQYGIPWLTWMMDAWIGYAPTFWQTFVNAYLGGAFTSNYVPSNVTAVNLTNDNIGTFPALPFNIWTHINTTASQRYMEYGFNGWGVTMEGVPQNYPVIFFGPCKLRVQVWGNNTAPYWGIITKDYYVNLAAGETWSIGTVQNPVEGVTVVYAWKLL